MMCSDGLLARLFTTQRLRLVCILTLNHDCKLIPYNNDLIIKGLCSCRWPLKILFSPATGCTACWGACLLQVAVSSRNTMSLQTLFRHIATSCYHVHNMHVVYCAALLQLVLTTSYRLASHHVDTFLWISNLMNIKLLTTYWWLVER